MFDVHWFIDASSGDAVQTLPVVIRRAGDVEDKEWWLVVRCVGLATRGVPSGQSSGRLRLKLASERATKKRQSDKISYSVSVYPETLQVGIEKYRSQSSADP